MPKKVRMVAKIITENCTGCRLCEQVCPTVAIGMRPRREDEPGKSRNIAELDSAACYNAQGCVELCADDAIEMVELEEPFEVGFGIQDKVDTDEVKALCKKSGFSPIMRICVCTDTNAGDIAAAVIGGADTPEAVSLATGVRTGCQELCLQPILRILAKAGHEDMERNPKTGFQWYGESAVLWDHLDAKGEFPEEILEHYPNFPLETERADMGKLSKRSRK